MQKFLKPKEGLLVRDVYTKKLIPAEGQMCPWNGRFGSYWRRMVKRGDCIIIEQETNND